MQLPSGPALPPAATAHCLSELGSSFASNLPRSPFAHLHHLRNPRPSNFAEHLPVPRPQKSTDVPTRLSLIPDAHRHSFMPIDLLHHSSIFIPRRELRRSTSLLFIKAALSRPSHSCTSSVLLDLTRSLVIEKHAIAFRSTKSTKNEKLGEGLGGRSSKGVDRERSQSFPSRTHDHSRCTTSRATVYW